MASPASRPSKSAVRAALLSARLYHDTREGNSLLRFAGFGVMEPKLALEIIERDAMQRDPYVPWLSLVRLDLAYAKLPQGEIDDKANEIPTIAQELRKVSGLSDELAAKLLAAAGGPDDREPLPFAKKWNTTVTMDGSKTVVVAEMEILADFNRVALMCDPRQWQNVSLFWYESIPVGVTRPPLGPLPSIDDPSAEPQPWSGTLREKVAGMGIMTVDLGVEYTVEKDKCTVKYWFEDSPDSNLKLDNGETTVERGEDGWLKTKVVKRIDFEDAPFGGPSSADLLAPSFISTWMRVQQDFWVAKATPWQPDGTSRPGSAAPSPSTPGPPRPARTSPWRWRPPRRRTPSHSS